MDGSLPSKVPGEDTLPHLHVINLSRLQASEPTLSEAQSEEMAAIGERLKAVFKVLLCGDEISSKYALLNLISKVYSRKDGLILGNVAVNFTNLDTLPYGGEARPADAFAALLTSIAERTLCLPITIDSLEQAKFHSSKNQDTNKLEQGVLQFVDGTLVLCDETKMAEGKLTQVGVLNIKTLASLIEEQQISYDFEVQQYPFLANAPVMVLSNGRSMFKNTLHVKVKPQVEAFDATKFSQILADSDLINGFRKYLETLRAGDIQFTMPEDVCEQMQQEFVEVRKREQEAEG